MTISSTFNEQRLWLTTDITLADFLNEAIASRAQVDILDHGTAARLDLDGPSNVTLHTGTDTHIARIRQITQLMYERYDAALQRHEQQQQQPVVLVIDDLPKLRAEAERTDPSVELALHSILRLGRTANIRLALNIPEPASPEDHVPEEARYNLGTFHRAFTTPRPGRKAPMTISSDDTAPTDFLNEQMRASFARRHSLGRVPSDVAQRFWSGQFTSAIPLARFIEDAVIFYGQRVDVLDRGTLSHVPGSRTFSNCTVHTGLDAHIAHIHSIFTLMQERYDALEDPRAEIGDLSPIVLAIDDFSGLYTDLEHVAPRTQEEILSLLRLGRTARIKLAVAVAGPDRIGDILPPETRDCFGFHYVFHTPDTPQN